MWVWIINISRKKRTCEGNEKGQTNRGKRKTKSVKAEGRRLLKREAVEKVLILVESVTFMRVASMVW